MAQVYPNRAPPQHYKGGVGAYQQAPTHNYYQQQQQQQPMNYPSGYASQQQPMNYPSGYASQQQPGYYTTQPTANMPPPPPGAPIQWMQRPNPINGVPSGLEYLHQIDKLFIEQKVDLLEAFTGWQENNRYVVRNAVGQQVYYDSETCMRMCCGASRGFTIHIVDNFNQEVLRIRRDFKYCAGCCCFSGCCDCCSHIVKIESPNGETLGYVRQKWSLSKPIYHIMDENETSLYKIVGPCCICDGPLCCHRIEFMVNDLRGGQQVGQICKEYSGYAREAFTNADNFSISFPLNISVNTKACFLGALFLIDFMHFENKNNNNNRNRGYY